MSPWAVPATVCMVPGNRSTRRWQSVNSHTASAIGEQFVKAAEANKDKDASVEAGRRFVAAYVSYTHFVEGIHAAITSRGGHQHAGTASPGGLDPGKHDAPVK